MERFSLWFVPTGSASDRLSTIIDRLSSQYGAPKFPPHVTLLGSLRGLRREVIGQCARVAAAVRPFTIRLGAVDCLDEYFRCLFIRAALEEPLRRAHEVACQVFGCKRRRAFMPHLSLLYGNYPPSLKEETMAELGRRVDLEFKVRSLHLYRTQGEPHAWRQLARLGLK